MSSGTCSIYLNQGASGSWVKIQNLVYVKAHITHPNASWTILDGLPTAPFDHAIGVIANADTFIHYVYITIMGTLQVRSGVFSETYDWTGCYVCN
jgi:hypothetical protein